MRWSGDDEWRVGWYAAPRDVQHRVRSSVRAGTALRDPAEAALAVGLAISRLVLHRWSLLAIPWLAGVAVVVGAGYLGWDPAAAVAVMGGLGGGVWLHRFLFAGPRLRRAYVRNLGVARDPIAAARRRRSG